MIKIGITKYTTRQEAPMSSKYNDLVHSGSEMNMGTCESEIKHPESLKDDARTLSNSKFTHNLSYIYHLFARYSN